jgi:hypothetical protein
MKESFHRKQRGIEISSGHKSEDLPFYLTKEQILKLQEEDPCISLIKELYENNFTFKEILIRLKAQQ